MPGNPANNNMGQEKLQVNRQFKPCYEQTAMRTITRDKSSYRTSKDTTRDKYQQTHNTIPEPDSSK